MRHIDTTEDVRALAEAMTPQERIEALVTAARASDQAEALIDELRQEVAAMDRVVSRHPAALADYDAVMLTA